MSRIRMLVALTVVASLALAGVALGAVTKVTGGSTTITISSAVSTALQSNHLTVTPLAPATESGSTFTFPIARGRLNTKSLHGYVIDKGGLAISNGTRTVDLQRPTLVSNRHGVSLFALVRGRRHARCILARGHRHALHCRYVVRYYAARIARITAISVSNGSATGTLSLTQLSASAVNRLAGKQIAKAGTPVGTATISPTLG